MLRDWITDRKGQKSEGEEYREMGRKIIAFAGLLILIVTLLLFFIEIAGISTSPLMVSVSYILISLGAAMTVSATVYGASWHLAKERDWFSAFILFAVFGGAFVSGSLVWFALTYSPTSDNLRLQFAELLVRDVERSFEDEYENAIEIESLEGREREIRYLDDQKKIAIRNAKRFADLVFDNTHLAIELNIEGIVNQGETFEVLRWLDREHQRFLKLAAIKLQINEKEARKCIEFLMVESSLLESVRDYSRAEKTYEDVLDVGAKWPEIYHKYSEFLYRYSRMQQLAKANNSEAKRAAERLEALGIESKRILGESIISRAINASAKLRKAEIISEVAEPGNLSTAISLVIDAVNIRREIQAAQPTDIDASRDLCWSLDLLYTLQKRRGDIDFKDFSNALRNAGESFDIRKQLWEDSPNDTYVVKDYVVAAGNLAVLIQEYPKYKQEYRAKDLLQQSASVILTLSKENPRDMYLQQNAAVTFERLGDLLLEENNEKDSFEAFQNCIQAWERGIHVEPNRIQFQLGKATALANVAISLSKKKNASDKVSEKFDEALALCKRALDLEPNSKTVINTYCFVLARQGEYGVQLNDAHGRSMAISAFRTAQSLRQQYFKKNKSFQAKQKLANAEVRLGKILVGDEAKAHLEQGIILYGEMVSADKKSITLKLNAAYAEMELGMHYKTRQQWNDSSGQIEKAITQYRDIVEISSRSPNAIKKLAIALRELAETYVTADTITPGSNRDRSRLAIVSLNESKKLSQEAYENHDSSFESMRELSYIEYWLTVAYGNLKDIDQQKKTMTSYVSIVDEMEKMSYRLGPQMIQVRNDFRKRLNN